MRYSVRPHHQMTPLEVLDQPHLALGVVEFRDHLAAHAEQDLAVSGRHDSIATPLEQKDAVLTFDALERLRQRGLGHVAGVGGLAKALVVRQGNQVSQVSSVIDHFVFFEAGGFEAIRK